MLNKQMIDNLSRDICASRLDTDITWKLNSLKNHYSGKRVLPIGKFVQLLTEITESLNWIKGIEIKCQA